MHGDFSRLTFDPVNQFSAVLSQQGRVQLDADANEQAAIQLHQLRTVLADLIGSAGCPKGDAGFGIATDSSGSVPDLTIGPGRMYVDGILVANGDQNATYWNQPDHYLDPERSGDRLPDPPYLVYLRVWERLVTAVQDPAIREIALGDLAPDTAARRQVAWHVAAVTGLSDAPAPTPQTALDWLNGKLGQRRLPTLRVAAKRPTDADQDVCDVSPEARYRGPENQLYRIEIHTGGHARVTGDLARTGPRRVTPDAQPDTLATFVWSRENGSVVFPVVSLSGAEVTLANTGRDRKLGLEVGDWVTVEDDASVARATDDVQPDPAPALRRVVGIDPDDGLVTLSPDTHDDSGCDTGTDQSLHPFLRRWDHHSATSTDSGPIEVTGDGALPVVEETWIDLEDGVRVMFPSELDGGAHQYRRGDYWTVPARTIIGDVLWPQDEKGPVALPPQGVRYHYAPLAYVTANGVEDLRSPFGPLAQDSTAGARQPGNGPAPDRPPPSGSIPAPPGATNVPPRPPTTTATPLPTEPSHPAEPPSAQPEPTPPLEPTPLPEPKPAPGPGSGQQDQPGTNQTRGGLGWLRIARLVVDLVANLVARMRLGGPVR